MRVLRYGDDAVLVECAAQEQVHGLCDALRRAAADGDLPAPAELVPGARSVLVEFPAGYGGPAAVRALLPGLQLTGAARDGAARAPVTLDVHYDGADLDLVAETAGCSRERIAELHAGATYTVAFCGFAPGFGYLTGLPPELHQPRLDSPRTSVPAGSVGVAGGFTAAYPRSSPGGWRLIGRTSATLFDPDAAQPAVLTPGTTVRFRAVR